MCRIIPLVKPIRSQNEENRVRASRWLFAKLFSKTTLDSVIRIVLEDLRNDARKTRQGMGQSDGGSSSKRKSSRKSSRHGNKHKSRKRDLSIQTKIRHLKFDTFLLQSRRGYLVDVLVEFLVNMRTWCSSAKRENLNGHSYHENIKCITRIICITHLYHQ